MDDQDKKQTTGHGHQSEQDYLVQQNQDYYREQFGRFNVAGKGRFRLTWNWAAFLLPYIWPAYRRMYGWTLAGTFPFVIAVYIMLAVGWSPKILIISHILLSLVSGATGNYLYYRKIQSALSNSSQDKCGTTISGAITAPLVFWFCVALFFGITLPGYLSYRDKGYELTARADLVNARTMLNAVYTDNGTYKTTALISSSGVTTLVSGTGSSSGRTRLSSRGVELKMLAAEKDCYLITSQHEQGRHIYLTMNYETPHSGYSGLERGIIKVLLPIKMNKTTVITTLNRNEIEKLRENDARAYRTALDARHMTLQIALKERGAYIDRETFKDLKREPGVTIDVPEKNDTASGAALFTRHDKGSMIFFTCGCSDRVFAIPVMDNAGEARIEMY